MSRGTRRILFSCSYDPWRSPLLRSPRTDSLRELALFFFESFFELSIHNHFSIDDHTHTRTLSLKENFFDSTCRHAQGSQRPGSRPKVRVCVFVGPLRPFPRSPLTNSYLHAICFNSLREEEKQELLLVLLRRNFFLFFLLLSLSSFFFLFGACA